MGKKHTFQLIILMAVLATLLVGGIACSNDQQEIDTNGDTQQDTPLMTAGEVQSLVYQYLDSRLYESNYRTALAVWGGKSGAGYEGNHVWSVWAGINSWLGCWSVYERTQVITPQNPRAQEVARNHFR
jgi:hypothetical protein